MEIQVIVVMIQVRTVEIQVNVVQLHLSSVEIHIRRVEKQDNFLVIRQKKTCISSILTCV